MNTPHVQNFTHELLEMAKAMERLPIAEVELAEARRTVDLQGSTIQRLELKLLDRSAEIDSLRAKLREVESERDDAGFRELEAQDRVNGLRGEIEIVLSRLGEALGITEGSNNIRVIRTNDADRAAYIEWLADRAAEAERKAAEHPTIVGSDTSSASLDSSSPPSQVEVQHTGSHDSKPESGDASAASEEKLLAIATDPNADINERINANNELATLQGVDADQTVGQSEVPPPSALPVSSDSTPSAHDGSASASEAALSGAYAGKKYYDHPYYVTEEGWVRGGGTLEDYHWRPAASI